MRDIIGTVGTVHVVLIIATLPDRVRVFPICLACQFDAVIEDAGEGLKQKTRGVVLFSAEPTRIKDGQVQVLFNLFCPLLLYNYPFLRVSFPIAGMYPVSVIASEFGETFANDENELTNLLAKIFTAPSTILTIQRLLALAKG